MSIERVHQNQGNVCLILFVDVLNLADNKIKEGLMVRNFNSGFGANTSHSGTKASIQFQDAEL